RCFVEQIRGIYWKNKIAATTVNLKEGKEVKEIEVFEIQLNDGKLDEAVLRQIDKEIPYHILFILCYENKYQAWIGYKEAAVGKNAFKVEKYYHTEWIDEEQMRFSLDGLDLDEVYENFVKYIAGDRLKVQSGEELKDSIERAEKREALQKRIDKLKAKIRKEKQFNVKMKMNEELKELFEELGEI
ncbi:MAG: DUF4391 domain-containing protein, partial [Firmicutes bacterium]|nr:DUF4391 domain-containing protein [Bacillota bacterium]